MAEKVNKTNTSFHHHSLINLCVLFVMSPGAEKHGSIVVYDFIMQYDLIHGLVAKSDICFCAKIDGFMHVLAYFLVYDHIFMNKHSINTISDRHFFSWYPSKCFIEDFLLQRTGSMF